MRNLAEMSNTCFKVFSKLSYFRVISNTVFKTRQGYHTQFSLYQSSHYFWIIVAWEGNPKLVFNMDQHFNFEYRLNGCRLSKQKYPSLYPSSGQRLPTDQLQILLSLRNQQLQHLTQGRRHLSEFVLSFVQSFITKR